MTTQLSVSFEMDGSIIIKKRKVIATVVSERARKKSLTKTSGITKQNSTGVEINLRFVLA